MVGWGEKEKWPLRGEESPTDHSRQGGFGRGMRIATGAERPRNDRSRKNLRVIPRPVCRLVVGIRNTPAQRSRRTDCHSQCAHWLRNDTFSKGCGTRQAGDRKGRPYGGLQVVQDAGRCGHRPLRKRYKRCGEVWNPPVTASPCQPPLGKGAYKDRVRIATTSLRTGLAMTWFLQGVRCKSGRADVGSELSAAGGRSSEVSEWPRSKF